MPILHDDEFGKITIRRSARSSSVRLRVGPDGTLRGSMPVYAPLFLLKRLVRTNREELRRLVAEAAPSTTYEDGMRIGKSHTLQVRLGATLSAKRHGQQIVVQLPSGKTLTDADVVKTVRSVVQTALRAEAKSYLPKRLQYLAEQHGYQYASVRFSHAGGRWGSCSSTGTISLNIALMKLPFPLIDYVLIHELCHTVHLNHSREFWTAVEAADPAYKQHRAVLKDETPSI